MLNAAIEFYVHRILLRIIFVKSTVIVDRIIVVGIIVIAVRSRRVGPTSAWGSNLVLLLSSRSYQSCTKAKTEMRAT